MFAGLKFRNRINNGLEADLINRGSTLGLWARIRAVLPGGTGSTSVGVALSPVGTGAISAHVPDGTSVGGNARGIYAVDLQTSRTAASHVASAQQTVVAGGHANTAGGNYSTCSGGQSNQSSGNSSVVAGGSTNTASGGQSTVSGGTGNIADGTGSWVPGGYQGTVRGLFGGYAWSAVQRSVVGDNQHFGQVTSRTTTDAATATDLTANRGAAGSENIMVLPNNSSASGIWLIHARDSSGNAATWIKAFRATRGANAASTAVAFSTDMMTASIDAALSTVTVSIIADTTNGGPKVQVTGIAATTIDWNAEPFALQIVR